MRIAYFCVVTTRRKGYFLDPCYTSELLIAVQYIVLSHGQWKEGYMSSLKGKPICDSVSCNFCNGCIVKRHQLTKTIQEVLPYLRKWELAPAGHIRLG